MIVKAILYFGRPAALACDARCDKAWGINQRPRVEYGEEDDFSWWVDQALGTAPIDPGTYEGGDAKPREPSERLNKWCARECERSIMVRQGELAALPDFSRPVYNMPLNHVQE